MDDRTFEIVAVTVPTLVLAFVTYVDADKDLKIIKMLTGLIAKTVPVRRKRIHVAQHKPHKPEPHQPEHEVPPESDKVDPVSGSHGTA